MDTPTSPEVALRTEASSTNLAAARDSAMLEFTRLADNRVTLTPYVTPIHKLTGFSARLGRDIWVKRDDLTGIALGGNKARKMEFVLAEARAQKADALITVGGPQSNHARTVASCAAVEGMSAHLVLGGQRPAHISGNLVLDTLFGAELHFADHLELAHLEHVAAEVQATLESRGGNPYYVDLGGSTATGTLGYAAAYFEAKEQFADFGMEIPEIVVASGSGGTQAGLELGKWLAGDNTEITGVQVADFYPDFGARIGNLISRSAQKLGGEITQPQPHVVSSQLGTGYGVESSESRLALEVAARTDGLVLDPVYTSKAFAALAHTPGTGPLLFWHTGGAPALFGSQFEL